jgi:hypothetical protein
MKPRLDGVKTLVDMDMPRSTRDGCLLVWVGVDSRVLHWPENGSPGTNIGQFPMGIQGWSRPVATPSVSHVLQHRFQTLGQEFPHLRLTRRVVAD